MGNPYNGKQVAFFTYQSSPCDSLAARILFRKGFMGIYLLRCLASEERVDGVTVVGIGFHTLHAGLPGDW